MPKPIKRNKQYNYYQRCPSCEGFAFRFRRKPKYGPLDPKNIIGITNVDQFEKIENEGMKCRDCGHPIKVLEKGKLIRIRIGTNKDPDTREWRWWENKDGSESIKITKLEMAFSYGATDIEACLYADITPRQLEYYQTEIKPEFVDRKRMLKKMMLLRAKEEVSKGIVGDKRFALDILARRDKDFSERKQFDFTETPKDEEVLKMEDILKHGSEEQRKKFLDFVESIDGADEQSEDQGNSQEA